MFEHINKVLYSSVKMDTKYRRCCKIKSEYNA